MALGPARDRASFNVGLGAIDVVQDWTHGLDKVVLDDSGFASFTNLLSHSCQDGASFVVQVDPGTAVWLNGATAAMVTAFDFTIAS